MSLLSTFNTRDEIPTKDYFKIGEVAKIAAVRPSVLRFWENEFSSIHPEKSDAGQRLYRRCDVEWVLLIKQLLHQERYSIEGARRHVSNLRDRGELGNYITFTAETAAPSPVNESLSQLKRAGNWSARSREKARLEKIQRALLLAQEIELRLAALHELFPF